MSKTENKRIQEHKLEKREFRESKFIRYRRKLSLFLDLIFEKISTPAIHIVLISLIILFVMSFFYGLFFYEYSYIPEDKLSDDTIPDEIDSDDKSFSYDLIESALNNSVTSKNPVKKLKYPFIKPNSWGEIKPLDDNWHTHAIFDVYAFLLSEMQISTVVNTQKLIDSLDAKMREYFRETQEENRSKFLRDFFRIHLQL